MNYEKIYNQLIQKRIKAPATKAEYGYVEKHHIIPKSLGGDNSDTNLVSLTAREHYVAHELLYKMYQNSNDYKAAYKMANAFILMHKYSGSLDKENNRFHYIKYNSRMYEEIRKNYKKIAKFKSIWNIQTNKQIMILEGEELPEGYTFKMPLNLRKEASERTLKYVSKIQSTFRQNHPGMMSPTDNKKLVHNIETNKQFYKDLNKEPLQENERLGENEENKIKFHNPTQNKKWVTNLSTLKFRLISNDEELEYDEVAGRLEKSKKEYLLSLNEDDRNKILNEMRKQKILIKSKKAYQYILNKEKYEQEKLDKLKYYQELHKIWKKEGFKAVKEKYNYQFSRVNLWQQFKRYGLIKK